MSPDELINNGENLSINYSFADSPFGNVILASTLKGICHMAFFENKVDALVNLQKRFPNAVYTLETDVKQQNALLVFQDEKKQANEIKLHLKGTPFQLKVWKSLVKIPIGSLSTYAKIAKEMKKPSAARAIGTAIGKNPVAILIPCHRVVQSSGKIGGFRWGSEKKSAIIAWEAEKVIV